MSRPNLHFRYADASHDLSVVCMLQFHFAPNSYYPSPKPLPRLPNDKPFSFCFPLARTLSERAFIPSPCVIVSATTYAMRSLS